MNILANERAVAAPGFDRWLIPPAALAVHLCIGQVYALAIFSEPLTRVIGVTAAAPGDWSLRALAPLFVVAISVLGLSTTIAAGWIDRQGPRAVMFLAACCFGGGLLVAALGIFTHQLWLLYLGYGGLGGVGLGLGYVAPVSTLIRWFPDRRGLASGLAIMGFGGGAMIAAPLSRYLMGVFKGPTSVGTGETFIAMGIIYFISMSIGAFTMRVPPAGWRPEGMAQDDPAADPVVAGRAPRHTVDGRQVMRTPQFYLLWILLCMNVTGGIELLGQAPDKILDTFPGAIPAAAVAGFVGLLGLFNMGGRLIWSASSDLLGRRNTYTVLLFLGAVFYAGVAAIGQTNVTLFVILYVLAISIYGGCFAMIPAYITDLFGSRDLTYIHGRLLSAWSVGVVLSSLISSLRTRQMDRGVPSAEVDDSIMYLAGALMLIGLICNLLIRPVHSRHHAPPAAARQARGSEDGGTIADEGSAVTATTQSVPEGKGRLLLAWLAVVAPLAWGIGATVDEAAALPISNKLGLTLLPLLLGVAVCFFFFHLDRSRFTIRGVVGPYFSSVAILFALFASLLAAELWQRHDKEQILLHLEMNGLRSMLHVTASVDPESTSVRDAIRSYLRQTAYGPDLAPGADGVERRPSEALNLLYRLAADPATFKGNAVINADFLRSLEVVRSAREDRTELHKAHVASSKFFTLLLFGLLTQIAIAFCHAGNPRALGAGVMLFSVAFSSAIGILALLDDPYEGVPMVSAALLNSF